MNTIKNEKGFTLIELVLVVVVLGILAAFATIQFGTIVSDAKRAALNGAKAPFSAQLALAINVLKAIPDAAQFGAEVYNKVTYDGEIVKTGFANNGATATWTLYTGRVGFACARGAFRTTGTYNVATGAISFSPMVAC